MLISQLIGTTKIKKMKKTISKAANDSLFLRRVFNLLYKGKKGPARSKARMMADKYGQKRAVSKSKMPNRTMRNTLGLFVFGIIKNELYEYPVYRIIPSVLHRGLLFQS